MLQICIGSICLVSATPPTVLGQSFWNFTGTLQLSFDFTWEICHLLDITAVAGHLAWLAVLLCFKNEIVHFLNIDRTEISTDFCKTLSKHNQSALIRRITSNFTFVTPSILKPCKSLFLKCPTTCTLIIPYLVLEIVQLKGISAIREAFCTGIQLLIAITDAERAEKVALTFEGHRV